MQTQPKIVRIAFTTLFTSVLWGFVLTQPAQAQFASVIEGTVTDQSGAAVPNAKITVINEATNVRYSGVSTSTGSFRVPALPSGTYRVEVQATGFKLWVQTGLILQPNKVRTVNPSLQLGEQKAFVVVKAAPTAVETGKIEAARTLSTTAITDAPIFNRNVYTALSVLAPGLTGAGTFAGNTATATGDNFGTEVDPSINAAGQRMETNWYYLDGSPVNVVSMGGTAVIQPEPDTVGEMKISAADFSADVGRGSGAIVQVFTKSGTNQFHGTLSEFHTDNDLTSRTIFETGGLPAFRRNEFGGDLGGPIIKNRTFFFGSLFLMRSSRMVTQEATVETPQFASYVENAFPNSIASTFFREDTPAVAPSQNIMSVSQVEASNPGHFAAPMFPADLPAAGTTVVNNVLPRNGSQWHARVDHNLNGDRDRIYFSIFRTLGSDMDPDPRPANRMRTRETSMLPKVDWIHTISPSLLNEASVTYLRTTGIFAVNTPNLPVAYVTGISQLGMWGGAAWAENDFNWHDTLSWMHSNHSIRAGLDVDRQKDDDNFTQLDSRPSFGFANLLDFAQDLPFSQSGPTINTITGRTSSDYMRQRILYWGPFVQDDWKVTPRFTLNLGLRYDYFGHLATIQNNHTPVPKFVAGQGQSLEQQIANGFMKVWGPGYQTSRTIGGVAPRIGFGWDIFGNGTTALRGGYGIFYNRYGNEAYRSDTNPPNWVTPSFNVFEGQAFSYALGPNFPPPPGFTVQINPRGGIVGVPVAAQGVDPNLPIPITHEWMLSLQRTVGPNILIEGDYYGTHSENLIINTDVNRFPRDLVINKGVLTRLNQYFGPVSYGRGVGISDSHYGSIMVSKRYSRDWSLAGIFTFGKATDDDSSFGTGPPNASNVINGLDPSSQHGRADFSIGEHLSLDCTLSMPVPWKTGFKAKALGGWRLETIGVLQSGFPFSVYTTAPYPTGDFNADGFNYDYPDEPAFGNHVPASRTAFIRGLFNASQFPIPSLGEEGNLGRNTFNGPGLASFNVELAKATNIPWFTREGASLELRADFFNVFNRVNLDTPVSDLSDPLFGRSTSQEQARSTQIGLYIRF